MSEKRNKNRGMRDREVLAPESTAIRASRYAGSLSLNVWHVLLLIFFFGVVGIVSKEWLDTPFGTLTHAAASAINPYLTHSWLAADERYFIHSHTLAFLFIPPLFVLFSRSAFMTNHIRHLIKDGGHVLLKSLTASLALVLLFITPPFYIDAPSYSRSGRLIWGYEWSVAFMAYVIATLYAGITANLWQFLRIHAFKNKDI